MPADQPCPLCSRPGIKVGPGFNVDTHQMEMQWHCPECNHTWWVPAETQPQKED